MTEQEKIDLIDSFSDFHLRVLYKALFDPQTTKMMQEYGGNPHLKQHTGKIEQEDGTIYHIWEDK